MGKVASVIIVILVLATAGVVGFFLFRLSRKKSNGNDSKCTYNTDCSSGYCNNGICGVPPVPLKELDVTCATDNECESKHCNGTCKQAPGSSCSVNDHHCDGICNDISNTCQSAPGGSCTENAHCTSNVCDDDTCIANAALYEQCTTDNECESGVCRSMTLSDVVQSLCIQPDGTSPLGGICIIGSECASGLCLGGHCIQL